jgi:hypothetical protein
VIGIAEPKYTQYETFETQKECLLERAVLTSTFTQGERALCSKKEK